MGRRNKYGAQPTQIDGIKFASKAEARRFMQLAQLEAAGQITDLELQPAFPLVVLGQKVCTYKADFKYKEKDGKTVVEDVKGMETPVFRLKWKLTQILYPSYDYRIVR